MRRRGTPMWPHLTSRQSLSTFTATCTNASVPNRTSSPAAIQPTTDITRGTMPDVTPTRPPSAMPSAIQAAPPSASSHWARLVARPVQISGSPWGGPSCIESTQLPERGHQVAQSHRVRRRFCKGEQCAPQRAGLTAWRSLPSGYVSASAGSTPSRPLSSTREPPTAGRPAPRSPRGGAAPARPPLRRSRAGSRGVARPLEGRTDGFGHQFVIGAAEDDGGDVLGVSAAAAATAASTAGRSAWCTASASPGHGTSATVTPSGSPG